VLCTRHICRSWRRRRVRRRCIIVAMIAILRGALLLRMTMLIVLNSSKPRLDRDNYFHRSCSLMQVANVIIMRPIVCFLAPKCPVSTFRSSFIVTRTMPVGNGGKFTPEARAIYVLVLEMQTVRL
jgi:hypothetical protein